MKRSISGWLDQATVFYTNALSDPAVLEALARFNVSQENLEQGQALVRTANPLRRRRSADSSRASPLRQAI